MHRPKPHIRTFLEKEILDGNCRLQQIGPLITIPKTIEKIPNLKKVQILEDRYTQIEKDNRLLLEKITNIMNCQTIKHDRPKRFSSLQTRKKQEEQQIKRENLILFKSIITQKSAYSKQILDKEWMKKQQYFYNLTGQRSQTSKNKQLTKSFEF